MIRVMKRVAQYLTVAILGFACGALALYVFWVRSGPALELWHTTQLGEEFTTQKLNEVRTFADYLRLEDRLFAQLNQQVYARTESGPAFEFARYSTGSAVDPRLRTPNWNRTFELVSDAPTGGVLLLHGMSDSPYSFRALGEALNERGFWVIGLRLPGHGTIPSGIKTITWEDMAGAVRLGMARLAAEVGQAPIHIMGYSTGAPLALDYALDALDGAAGPVPGSLVLVSPAIAITPAVVLTQLKTHLSELPGLEQLAWTLIAPEFDPFRYISFTANAGVQVHRLTQSVASRIESRSEARPIENFPPTLVFLSAVDATVSVDAVVDNLLEHLAPGRHELVLFDVNRSRVKSTLLVSDPGPLTGRLLASETLPFHLTLIANAEPASNAVVSRRKAPLTSEAITAPLHLSWPPGVVSLSHVALPISPDDPLYGRRDSPHADQTLKLGQLDFRGERGVLKFPADWLLRLRYNPFYDLLESRVIDWVGDKSG